MKKLSCNTAILVLCVFMAAVFCTSRRATARPNVLFISVDDLNDWIGCLGGHPQAKTPNIDRLAASGLLFENAYCAAPSCNPSRTALMTGIAPHHSGLYTNRQKMRQVLPDAQLIPAYFSQHGYWSASGGKILHYITDAQSWDQCFPNDKTPFPPYHYPKKRPHSVPFEKWMYREFDWGGFDMPDSQFKGDFLVAQWAAKHLTRKHEKPFFLACGIYRPHLPWFAPKKYFDMFPLDQIKMPPGVLKNDADDLPAKAKRLTRQRYHAHVTQHGLWKQGVQAYLASIAYADAMVGLILDALERGPHAKNTIVVLWSDHGWHLGEKTRWRKFALWRQTARVPLIIRVPKSVSSLPQGTRAGLRCKRPVNLVDLYKTLNALCSLPKKKGIDGHSLLPLLQNPEAKWPHPALPHLHGPDDYAISTQQWRYIHYSDGGEELYHLPLDPYEWHNLAGKQEHLKQLIYMRGLAPKRREKVSGTFYWLSSSFRQGKS